MCQGFPGPIGSESTSHGEQLRSGKLKGQKRPMVKVHPHVQWKIKDLMGHGEILWLDTM